MGTVINRIFSKSDFDNMGVCTIPTLTTKYGQLRWFPDLLYIFEPTALNTALHQYDKNFIETLPTNLGITCIAQPLFDAVYLYNALKEEKPGNLILCNYATSAGVSKEQFLTQTGFKENITGGNWPLLYDTSTGEVDNNYKFIVPTDEQLGKDIAAQYDLAEGLLFDVSLPQTYSWPLKGDGTGSGNFWSWLALSYNTQLLTFTIPIGSNDPAFPPTDESAKYMIPKLFVPYMTSASSTTLRNPIPVIYWLGIKEIN